MSCTHLKGSTRVRLRSESVAIAYVDRFRRPPGVSAVRTREAANGASKYVSAEAIASEYDVPVSQVHRGAREGWLPVMKFGRYSRFDPETVKAALERRGDHDA